MGINLQRPSLLLPPSPSTTHLLAILQIRCHHLAGHHVVLQDVRQAVVEGRGITENKNKVRSSGSTSSSKFKLKSTSSTPTGEDDPDPLVDLLGQGQQGHLCDLQALACIPERIIIRREHREGAWRHQGISESGLGGGQQMWGDAHQCLDVFFAKRCWLGLGIEEGGREAGGGWGDQGVKGGGGL